MTTLYLVATPIGNLEDMSFRGVRILNEVGLIAAEDTRHSRKLLSHFDIHTPITSYYDHNKNTKTDYVIEKLNEGDVALISDAGMPGINDPGFLLVQAALAAGHEVTVVPGPSAPVSALVLSGLPNEAFLYLGYLPRKESARVSFLKKVAAHPYTLIFFETPHRLLRALQDLQTVLGNRRVAVASELTKMYEEVFRGDLQSAIAYYEQSPARGEFTLVVEGAEVKKEVWTEDDILTMAEELFAQDQTMSEVSATLAGVSDWKKKAVYQLLLQHKNKADE